MLQSKLGKASETPDDVLHQPAQPATVTVRELHILVFALLLSASQLQHIPPHLLLLPGGKLLVLYGGMSRGSNTDGVGREVAVLNAETMHWERPGTARTPNTSHSHTGKLAAKALLSATSATDSYRAALPRMNAWMCAGPGC